VFHRENNVENTTLSGMFFDEIPGVLIADETLCRVKTKSKQKQKSKIVKISDI